VLAGVGVVSVIAVLRLAVMFVGKLTDFVECSKMKALVGTDHPRGREERAEDTGTGKDSQEQVQVGVGLHLGSPTILESKHRSAIAIAGLASRTYALAIATPGSSKSGREGILIARKQLLTCTTPACNSICV